MDRYYLTDTIFIKDSFYFYEKNNKEIKIKENDWHIYLKEYGWNKLNKKWIIKLNKLSNKKYKNSPFSVLDCGAEGDCLFKCISYALLPYDKIHENDNNFKIIRNILSDHINEELFKNITDIYKISKNNGEFKELWDPYSITIEEFKCKIKSGGNDYWGDFILLDILREILKINIIVMYTNIITEDYYNYPLFYDYNINKKTIILSYEDDEHFKLIGYYNDSKIIYLFNHEDIPIEILRLTNIMR
tara:strand:- start:2510 stop:3244 length:735 start_codon:yes stop_codon:yes gene_type:complete